MYQLKQHHKLLLSRLGVKAVLRTARPSMATRAEADVRRVVGLCSTSITYGFMGPERTPRANTHRVRIMEPGSARITFIDCEVPCHE